MITTQKTAGSLKNRTLQLVLTRDCNLRCTYCYETKSREQMPVEVALDVVREVMSDEEDGFEGVIIDFFGGEPFMAFDTMRAVVDLVHSRKWPKGHHFSASTNGTQINEEMKRWMVCHQKCLTVGLSLDGTKEAHDHNRSNSYDAVARNVPFFKSLWPDQPVKMTISQYTIDQIAAGIKSVILDLGMSVHANVVFENVWDGMDKMTVLLSFRDQLEELIEFFLANPQFMVPNLLSVPFQKLGLDIPSKPIWCGTGKYMLCVDVDGKRYPCQRFTPFCSGCAHPLPSMMTLVEDVEVNGSCADCPIVTSCPTCAGYNWSVSGQPHCRTNAHCEFVLLQMLASAKLAYLQNQSKIKKISSGNTESLNPEEAADLRFMCKAISRTMQIVPEVLKQRGFGQLVLS